MANSFAITAATNTAVLGAQRRGEASFTVTNVSGRAVRGRARAVASSAVAQDWLSLAGDAERDFALAGTQQFTVQIAVPPAAPPGPYTVRLDVANVADPDEDFAQGPTVAFEVAP